jgi:hypothetical protein
MKRTKILSLAVSFVISLTILLALPFFSQSNKFQAKASSICAVEGGSCWPQEYNCVDGVDSPLTCGKGEKCYFGGGCTAPTGPTAGCPSGSINTALGCFYIKSPNIFIIYLLRAGIGLGGGLAFMLMVYAGFIIMTSSGDPRRLTAGKELFTAAISGLLFLVGGVYVLRLIGVDLLGLF